MFIGGPGAMGLVAPESTKALPTSSVAVSRTRSAWPSSSGVARYVASVAKGIGAQLAPALSQRYHAYVRVTVPVPVHVPGVTPSTRPSCNGPVMAGAAVLCGGTPTITAVRAESAKLLPAVFCAVTRTFSLFPTSAPTTVYCWLEDPSCVQFAPDASQRNHV